MKTRDIVIDADHILYLVCFSKDYNDGFEVVEDADADFEGFDEDVKIDLTRYINHFKAIVTDYITTAEVESIAYNWKIGKTRIILSDHSNFRYDIFPEYKAKRDNKNELLSAMKEWAMGIYNYEPNTEADDIVAYYVRKGGLGFTTDKDLFKGVAGIWYNSHFKHRCWVRTTKEDADFFFKCQVLAGDPVDEIPSLPKVGILTAQKLLKKYGTSWENILQIFIDKGYDKKYMRTMARLVAMNQWTPKHGIKLWKEI